MAVPPLDVIMSNKDIPYLKAKDLEKLPTLAVGHFDNLKIDTGKIRVWLSRMSRADGRIGGKVNYEKLIKGCWIACNKWGRPL